MKRKGQAAMEFLMTYGWAILAAVIVVGVLASFGVFKPSTYIPNECSMTAPLGCNAGNAETNQIQIEIRNGAGEALNVTSVDISGCGTINPNALIADASLTVYTVTCTSALPEGKFQGDITVSYYKAGSSIQLSASGRIVDKV